MMQIIARYPIAATVLLLSFSNLFMTIAWYGHLEDAKIPLVLVILMSWAIARRDYC